MLGRRRSAAAHCWLATASGYVGTIHANDTQPFTINRNGQSGQRLTAIYKEDQGGIGGTVGTAPNAEAKNRRAERE